MPKNPQSPSGSQLNDHLVELLSPTGPLFEPIPPRDASPPPPPAVPEVPGWAEAMEAARFLMAEEEKMSWLHHPTGNDEERRRDICWDLMACAGWAPAAEYYTLLEVDQLPPPPPVTEVNQSLPLAKEGMQGSEEIPTAVMEVVGDSAVVDSNEMPTAAKVAGTLGVIREAVGEYAGASSSAVNREHGVEICDGRKRKAKTDEGSGCEGDEFKPIEESKNSRHRPIKRSRAADVHNLSEKKRRDRINEKMKTLQQMIPRCNKSDKASLLDGTIEYLKSLQLQKQMMAMICNMGSMMYPGMQPYMIPINMTMGMGLAIRPHIGVGGLGTHALPFKPIMHPMMRAPHAHILTSVPLYHSTNIPTCDQFNAHATHMQDITSSSLNMQGPNMAQIPNVTDMYHGYAGSHHIQNRAMNEP